jgi:hypothetical protein
MEKPKGMERRKNLKGIEKKKIIEKQWSYLTTCLKGS